MQQRSVLRCDPAKYWCSRPHISRDWASEPLSHYILDNCNTAIGRITTRTKRAWVSSVPVQVLRRFEARWLQVFAEDVAQLHEAGNKVCQAGLLQHVRPHYGGALGAAEIKESMKFLAWCDQVVRCSLKYKAGDVQALEAHLLQPARFFSSLTQEHLDQAHCMLWTSFLSMPHSI